MRARSAQQEKSPEPPAKAGFSGLSLWRYRWDLNSSPVPGRAAKHLSMPVFMDSGSQLSPSCSGCFQVRVDELLPRRLRQLLGAVAAVGLGDAQPHRVLVDNVMEAVEVSDTGLPSRTSTRTSLAPASHEFETSSGKTGERVEYIRNPRCLTVPGSNCI